MDGTALTIGRKALLACVLEVTARKPGNVHPWAPAAEMDYTDFVLAAHAIVEPMERAGTAGVGQTVLAAIRATRAVTSANVNLGIVLLFAPLAVAAGRGNVLDRLSDVLQTTTPGDAELVYEAIRLAAPGGLGKVAEEDVHGRPTRPLQEVMALAADRDLIAAQYANGFREIQQALGWLVEICKLPPPDWETAVLTLYARLLATWPDTLIRRKHGDAVAERVRSMAASLVGGKSLVHLADLSPLDQFLRTHRPPLNPGTTADFVAATLFLGLLQDELLLRRLFHGPATPIR